MPWTPNDGPARHTKKANTPAKRKQWSDIANKVLSEGGEDAEGKAVRIANAQVKNHPSKKRFGLARAPGE